MPTAALPPVIAKLFDLAKNLVYVAGVLANELPLEHERVIGATYKGEQMGTAAARLVGTEWEDWANRLLTHHYGPTDYQRVPSKDRGDAGIEGYSINTRTAFQCYGCEEPIGVSERYQKQRDKMTEDIGKFIKNKATLQGIFKPLQMSRWVLFVPIFDSKDIATHAAKKTQEVIDADLPYVASDFRVVVVQESSYSQARDQLLSTTPSGLKFVKPVVSEDAINVWSSSNDGLVGVLQDKLSKLPSVKTDEKRDQLVLQVLKWYLIGQELMRSLREYPEVYEKVIATKSHREDFLSFSCLDGDASKGNLTQTIKSFEDELRQEVAELHSSSAECLAVEAVADWLMRCPLSFPEVVNG